MVDSMDDVLRAAVEDASVDDRNPTVTPGRADDDRLADEVLLLASCTPSNCPVTVADADSFTDNLLRLSANLFAVNDTDCDATVDDGTVTAYAWLPRGYPATDVVSGPEL